MPKAPEQREGGADLFLTPEGLPSPKKSGVVNRDELTEPQRNALMHVDRRASAMHKQAKSSLRARVVDLGFSASDYDNLLAYGVEFSSDGSTVLLLC